MVGGCFDNATLNTPECSRLQLPLLPAEGRKHLQELLVVLERYVDQAVG